MEGLRNQAPGQQLALPNAAKPGPRPTIGLAQCLTDAWTLLDDVKAAWPESLS